MAVIEIEVDTPTNDNLLFPPTQMVVRGRFVLMRVAEPMAGAKRSEWGDEIPGQVIGFDTETKRGWVREPLYLDEFAESRRRIERKGFRISNQEQAWKDQDAPTWLFWMKRYLDEGFARIKRGDMPAQIEGKPRLNFFRPVEVDQAGQMMNDLKSLSDMNRALVEQNRQLMQRLDEMSSGRQQAAKAQTK